MSWLLAAILLLVGGLLSSSRCSAQVYYVKPAESPDSNCPGEPCHTLNYYAQNASSLLSGKSNVSLVFLEGLHVLTVQSLEVSDTTNLTLTGMNETHSMVDNPVVNMSGDWGMVVERVDTLRMAHLSVVNASIDVTLTRKFSHYNVAVVSSVLNTMMTTEVQLHYSMYNGTIIYVRKNNYSFGSIVFQNLISESERLISFRNCTMCNTHLIIEPFLANITLHQCYLQGSMVGITSPGILSLTEITSHYGLFQLYGLSKVTMDTCSFKHSNNIENVSPFVMDSINVFFIGETVFTNNTGYQGGALYLVNTTLYFEKHSRLKFANNTAINIGGAVYVDAPKDNSLLISHEDSKNCVFSLTYDVDEMQQLQSSIHFEGNVAGNGGDNIYGTSLKSNCLISPNAQNFSYQLQSDLFQLDNKSLSSISSVSSDPMRVCLCENGVPQCANYSYIVQQRMYTPGEKFNVSLVLVGADFGSTIGSVYALFSRVGQSVNGISNTNCSTVEYSVYEQEDSGSSILSLASNPVNNVAAYVFFFGFIVNDSIHVYQDNGYIDNKLATTPLFLNITIQKCPLGFVFDNGTSSCGCVEVLMDVEIDQCTVINGTGIVYRSGTAWVSHSGTIDVNNTTDGVLVYKYCPYGYCNTNKTGVDLYEPDSQCAFNHSGILCGGCPSNLSLALGSSQCLHCTDDWHISLLVIFVIAGVVLVLFIKLFDLTVTKGAVNGLIFYANIIWIHQSVFFPYGTNYYVTFQILKVFIAWINLDLGIETCFFHGLDAYWKTWLQFIFPFYIWGLAGLIIILCRYSNKVTEVFGNNSVHVLATLFLLSYVKLLRTIISSLVFAPLQYPDGIRVVWLLDGNLPYFGLRHSFLFVAAILVLFTFWLPYTATILLVPCLRKYCNFSWIIKLKPFYDAHYGPLKDNHHYWIGLTLLVRVVLAVTAIALEAINPTINLLLVVILSSLLCCLVNQAYKKNYISALETSFYVNLIILTSAFQYTTNPFTKLVITCVSVGVSFITFLAILIAQAYSQLKSHCRSCRIAKYRGYENIDNVQRAPQVPTHSIVSVNNRYETSGDQLREPLLESD